MTSTLPVPPAIVPPADPPPSPATARGRLGAFLRGPAGDPAGVRPALLVLLLGTGLLYLWGLDRNGWANAFYSAAVQAGSESWKAFFFGSSDAANSITVDKTPASLWPMALAARIFGVSSWTILVPQALMGVAAVGVVYATVRRWYGPVAGLVAGAVLATTPVAALMFRFNNPDAMLVLLLALAAWATVRAIETGATRWLVWAGVFVGFGFLAKMLQALLVVPALGLAYLLAGPPKLGRRIVQLFAAGAALVVSAGWYILVVEVVPASMRPYIGGSQDNSILELTLGYNGLGRLNGDETGSVGGGGGRGWGETGWLRMFDAAQGGQIAWLLPAALLLLVAGLVVTARAPRTDRSRAGFLVWGGWLVVTLLVFSFMQGIFHAYYTVALAPAVGALTGMGAAVLWRLRRHPVAAATLAVTVAGSAVWGYVLLGRSADFVPWLRWVVLAGGVAAAVGLLITSRMVARFGAVAAALALSALLAGPAAYAVETAASANTGSLPSAGPQVAGAMGAGPGGRPGMRGAFPGGRPDGRPGGFPGGTAPGGTAPGGTAPGGTAPGGTAPGGTAPGGTAPGGFPGGTAPGGTAPGGFPGGTAPGGTAPGGTGTVGGPRGGMGGLLDAATVSARMKSLLEADAGSYTWVAAAVGSQNASGYQLATGEPVMAIGGFNGSDPSPTLAQFQQYVADGRIHYFLGGGFGGRGPGGSNAAAEIAAWVSETFPAQTVDGVTVYDLTARAQAPA